MSNAKKNGFFPEGNTDSRNSATCILADELADYKTMIGKAEGLCAHPKCQPGTIAQW
jgi:hypothetical protein